MVNKTDQFNVDLQITGQQKADKLLEAFLGSERATAQLNKNLKAISAQTAKLQKEWATMQTKFGIGQRDLKTMRLGTPGSAVTLAKMQGDIANIRADDQRVTSTLINEVMAGARAGLRAAQSGRILEMTKAGTVGTPSSDLKFLRDQIKAQEIIMHNWRQTNSERTLGAQKFNQQLKIQQATMDRLVAQENQLLTAQRQRNQIANLRADTSNPQLQQARREANVERVVGDGGASLFRIQAQLLGNYLVMNKIFQLFNFGTQFVLELDQAFRQFQAITATTETEMVGLRDRLMEVSESTKFTAVEVAKAATTMGQAGFSSKQVADSIEGVTFLATAVGTDLQSAVDLATSTMSIFNLRAEEMGHVANVLTGAVNRSKLTIDKLTLGLQYAGNTAAQAGATLEETVAILGAMANAGIRSGSTLGTGLRQAMVSFMAPTEKLTGELQKVGLNLDDIDIRSKGLIGVFETLKNAGFGVENAFAGMQVRAAAAYIAISNNLDVVHDLEQSLLLTNAAAEANAVQLKSLTTTLDLFKSTLGITITRFAEPFKNFLITTTNLVRGFLQIINQIPYGLELMGTALITLGSAAMVKQIARLGSELLKMTNGLKSVVSAATKGVEALEDLGDAAEVTTSKGAGLYRFFTSLPGAVTLATIGVIGLVSGLNYLSEQYFTMAKATDEAKAATNEAQGEFDKTSATILSINEAVDRLNDRYSYLTKDSKALETETLKLEVQFGDMGISIDRTNKTVDSLIDSLSNLKRELVEISNLNIQDVLEANAREWELAQTRTGRAGRRLSALAGNNEWIIPSFSDVLTSDTFTPSKFIDDRRYKFDSRLNLLNQDSQTFGGMNLQNMTPTDIRENIMPQLSHMRDMVRSVIFDMTNEINEIVADIESGELGRDETIAARLALETLRTKKDAVVNYQNQLATNTSLAMDRITSLNEELVTEIQMLPAVEGAESLITRFKQDTNRLKDKLTEAGKKDSEITQREVLENFRGVNTNLEEGWKEFIASVMSIPQIANLSEDHKKAIEDYLRPKYAEAAAEQVNLVNDRFQMLKEAEEDLLDIQVKTLDQQITNLEHQLETAQNNGDTSKAKEIASKIDELIGRRADRRIEQLSNEMDTNEDENNLLRIRQEGVRLQAEADRKKLQESLNKRGREARATVGDLVDAMKEPIDHLKRIKEAVEQAMMPIDRQIKSVETHINAARPGGSLSGRYGDAQLADMAIRQEQLQTARLAQQINSLTKAKADIEELLSTQQANADVLNKQVQAMNRNNQASDATRAKIKKLEDANRDVTKSREELLRVTKELSEVEAEYGVRTGKTAEASYSLMQEIGSGVRNYADEQSLQNLRLNIQENITQQFQNAEGAFTSFMTETTNGTKTISSAFGDMARSIISSLHQMATQWVSNQIFGTLLSAVGSFLPGNIAGTSSTGSVVPDPGTGFGPLQPLNNGGFVRANNGYSIGNRDAVPILARKGEFVLRNSAVQMIGEDNLKQLNAMGNRKHSRNINSIPLQQQSEPVITNVYVVSPDQQPSMGPRDVIVTIADDLARGGTTKKLIKQIIAGR